MRIFFTGTAFGDRHDRDSDISPNVRAVSHLLSLPVTAFARHMPVDCTEADAMREAATPH